MNVTAMRPKASVVSGEAPFRAALSEMAANELIFGVVGPVGSGTTEIAGALQTLLIGNGYDTTILKARTVIEEAAKKFGLAIPTAPSLLQSEALQNAGDEVRARNHDNAAVAVGMVGLVRSRRAQQQNADVKLGEAVEPDGQKRAYILDSLRHPHEVALLRRVYQDAFCMIGVFCHEEERLRRLQNDKFPEAGLNQVKRFMERDENATEANGQKVADAFHLADYFVDNTVKRFIRVGKADEENPEWDVPDQLGRLVDVLTHGKIVTPRAAETGMFHAYGARMRSSCLSRQVGAALIDGSGTLISTGTNEVPRAGGGVYGGTIAFDSNEDLNPELDFRCFVHNRFCSNTREQNSIIRDLFGSIDELKGINLNDDLLKRVRKTRIGQLVEFSRAVHAEMDVLLSAARSGARTGGSRLYVTTFPCHNCARHIVSAGVLEVQYIEPYLKSQAIPLHGDAIVTDPKKWNRFDKPQPNGSKPKSPNVLFRPFIGVAPRLYRRAFFKDRELKNSLTGDMVTEFSPSEGHATTETLKMSYAQVEAKLSELLARAVA